MALLHRVPPRFADLGAGLTVRRLLPSAACRKVGPWVFLDHFGPIEGRSVDVPPHPHIGLSTVTYLFEGAIEHRDSTGGHSVVRPGEVHWMRAGHGVVHSERAPRRPEDRAARMHGLQLWCAHPDGAEDQEPRFDFWTDLPRFEVGGARVHLLAGDGWRRSAPVAVTSPLVYAVVHLSAGQRLDLPDHAERCAFAVHGSFAVDGDLAAEHELLVVDPHARALVATTDAVVAVLGGAPIGPRHMWWNFVHSDPQRLVDQAERWRRGGFPTVPGDDDERLTAPRGP
jgi:hypothetical protein